MAVSQTLDVTQQSQNVSENHSKVRIVWKSTQTGESYNGYTRTAYYYVSTNGGAETRYSVKYTLPKGATKTLVDTVITVNHKADGKGTVKVRTWMDTDISAGVVEKETILNLDTIPRATQHTLSASSADMGAKVTISCPRAASSFTHDLAYKIPGDDYYTAITTGAGTSYSWTVPDRATAIPNATSVRMTVRCITKSGSTTIGTKYAYITAKVPSSVIPTVTSVTAAEAVSGLAAQFGAYVQTKSKIKATIVAAGAKGSTIKEYSSTFAGKTYTGRTWTSDTLASSGTLTIRTRVKDSRGRWSAYKNTTITVVAYSKPAIRSLTVYRCNSAGVAADDGTYLALAYNYSVASVGGKNTAAATVQYKQSTASDYGSTLLELTALSGNTTVKPASPTFSIDYTYNFRLTVEDWFGATAVAETTLPSGKVILDILGNGRGIGVGKTAEQEGIDIGWPIVGRIVGLGSMAGRYRTEDGLLLQWGGVSITPTAANEPTTAVVTFPLPFTETPTVFVTPVSSVPHTLSVGIQRSGDLVGDNKLKVAVTLVRSGLTSTGINWLAIGKG